MHNAYCSGISLLSRTLANSELSEKSIVCVQHCVKGERNNNLALEREINRRQHTQVD